MAVKIIAKNRKASFNYIFLEQFTAGIQLTGTEIKSVKAGKVSLADSYCFFREHELWIQGMHIAPYWWGTFNNHDPLRQRKLLLQRKELTGLERRLQDKGLTIAATSLFLNEKGYAKLNIALCRGKKLYDKRETLKQKDAEREMARGGRFS